MVFRSAANIGQGPYLQQIEKLIGELTNYLINYPICTIALPHSRITTLNNKYGTKKKRGQTGLSFFEVSYLLFPAVLSLLAEMVTIFETITFLATYAIHCATETDCRSSLIFFKEPA